MVAQMAGKMAEKKASMKAEQLAELSVDDWAASKVVPKGTTSESSLADY